MELNERVLSWGMPEYFEDKGIKYNIKKPGHFFLIDEYGEERFEMYFISTENEMRAFPQPADSLDLSWIHVFKPEDRKKGVASYYIRKLVEYCKELNITNITLSVVDMDKGDTNEKSDAVKGKHLRKLELINFYKKHIEIEGGLNLDYF
ncbi:hypothetical protein [Enterococcus hirae]|uniref:hypothetical protein n=1 Tax=Enterococcus hirae TaxID=1354 RepID=UPI000F4ED836|nr:hypothetical protein [Enterococcus hirae]ROY48076.1 hypothetical protein EGW66_10400 [Enterococcus hirae]